MKGTKLNVVGEPKKVAEIIDNSEELLKRRAEKDAEIAQNEAALKIAQEQFQREAAGQQAAPSDPLLRWFNSEGLQQPFAGVVSAYGNLAKAICKFITPSAERTETLRDLLRSKDGAIRAMLTPPTE